MEKSQSKTKQKLETRRARRYKVIFLNDNFTSFEFVALALITHFSKLPDQATLIATEVHEKGRAVAGVFSKEVAMEKIKVVQQEAKQEEYPLKLVMEPEEQD